MDNETTHGDEMNNAITATIEQISALMSEAGLAGDYETRELCERALEGDEAAEFAVAQIIQDAIDAAA